MKYIYIYIYIITFTFPITCVSKKKKSFQYCIHSLMTQQQSNSNLASEHALMCILRGFSMSF